MANEIYSHNILVIESINSNEVNDDSSYENMSFDTKLNAEFKFHCSVTGRLYRKLVIESIGNSSDMKESMKKCIQNFMDGNFTMHNEMYECEIKSLTCYTVHHIDIQVGEPFKSLFESLFKRFSEFPKKIANMKNQTTPHHTTPNHTKPHLKTNTSKLEN
jgi:hypothetical protein